VSTGARAANDDVQIVGWYEDSSSNFHGFLDDAGTFSSIDNSATHTEADGINGVGEVVGYYEDSRGNNHAFLYQNGQIVATFSCQGAGVTYFIGINNNQLIAGMCNPSGQNTGFLYDYSQNKLVTTFSVSGSIATWGQDINDQGEIVGNWADSADVARAFYVVPSY